MENRKQHIFQSVLPIVILLKTWLLLRLIKHAKHCWNSALSVSMCLPVWKARDLTLTECGSLYLKQLPLVLLWSKNSGFRIGILGKFLTEATKKATRVPQNSVQTCSWLRKGEKGDIEEKGLERCWADKRRWKEKEKFKLVKEKMNGLFFVVMW